MRTGSCAVQQGLTPEAASIVKQAVTLAKRRGHAQVTPLHVANTMLSITNGLLRTACLQSHSHPLQCKALELCFNVALNRLPASTSSSPMLQGSHHHHSHACPSISNALVAAFKRAQAHQRRGSIENQQQPLLAVKIELEQLIISILDDPSVSRVMREAGFSSTQVKSNVEQAVSLEICSQNNGSGNNSNSNGNSNTKTKENSGSGEKGLVLDPIRGEDVASVIENLASQRKRSVVIVGECVTSMESVVRGVMEKVDRGDAGECLRGVKFIPLSLSSFGNVSRVEVEQKIEELRNLVKRSEEHNKGYVLYLGDLKWVFDYRSRGSQGRACYCPVDHMVMEIGKLVNGFEENGGRFRLMGVATFQAYMRCKNGQPSLETLWDLHPITIPAGTLRLSLITDSGVENEAINKKADKRSSWLLLEGVEDEHKQQPCFAEASTKNETEIRSFQSSTCNSDSSTSTLPAWLQQYKNENKGITYNDQNCVPVGELCKKWNSMCSSIQKQPYPSDKTLTLSSVSPSSSTSGFSYEQQHSNLHQTHHEWQVGSPKDSLNNHHFWVSNNGCNSNPKEPTLRVYIPENKDNNTKQPFSSPNPNSASSSDVMEVEHVSRFKELNSENLKTLCNALEKKVSWQKDIIPEIASTILQCRSGMVRRKGRVRNSEEVKEETWLVFQGVDVEAKEKITRELARLVFGSHNHVVSIALSSFASTRADSTEDYSRNKRSREETSCSYIERFAEAMMNNPHRVFLVEDIEQADYCSQLGFKRAMERGRVADSNGEEIALCDAIIILSCESFSSRSRTCSPSIKQKSMSEEEKINGDIGTLEETSPCVSLDLNISIDDENEVEDRSVDEIGLLESVDRKIIFNFQEL
ncbi:ATP-dependent Clp protease ATP-binding subunit ClpB [Vigna unguiculata]|uniref:ATP-dependent Clp protease ATP-binding subunit ClpB n=1 Tax=Vigna unguiculata TaxID=3917 RepID=A0A4D6MZ48_VIGUN|nr:ATP-dependent Clp protease ATP-binding subunit ClpB [Vigna unguiculata]